MSRGRPTTLPEPWRSLAAKLGGVAELAKALGTVPRTINDWAAGVRVPRGPAWLLIQKVFQEAGLPIPPRETQERKARMNSRKFLDEITVGLLEYQSAKEYVEDGGLDHIGRIRAADALARVEAAGIAITRSAYAALLDLTDAKGDELADARQRCEDLRQALSGPLEVLTASINRGVGPDDARRAQTLRSLETHRQEAMRTLNEAIRNLDRIESRQTH